MIKLFIEYNKETLDKMYHAGNASDDELVCDIMVNDFIKNYKDEYIDAYFYDFNRFEEVHFEQITHKYQTYQDIFYLPDRPLQSEYSYHLPPYLDTQVST